MNKKLTQEILKLIEEGKTIRQAAVELNCSHNTIERHLKKAGIVRRPIRRWTEYERQKIADWLALNKSYEYIAKKLNRSVNAVEIEISRRRKAIKNDPEKQRVLKVLSFCMNPGRILKAARDMHLLDEIRKSEIEEGL